MIFNIVGGQANETEVTFVCVPERDSVSLKTEWNYNYSSQSGINYTYSLSNKPFRVLDRQFDLTSLPKNAKIKSAVLSWNTSTSNSGISGLTGQYTGPKYGTIEVDGTNNYISTNININEGDSKHEWDFVNDIMPGENNLINFGYSPSVANNVTLQYQVSQISCSSTLTLSNLMMTVIYSK